MRISRIQAALACLAVTAFAAVAMTPASAQGLGKSYDIMAPEPWLPPKPRSVAKPSSSSGISGLHRPRRGSDGISVYNRPRRGSDGLINAERIPKSKPLPGTTQPQLTTVPGIGTFQNLPPARGAGVPETFNDRAIRCSHQSGLYGVSPGQTGAYTRACAN